MFYKLKLYSLFIAALLLYASQSLARTSKYDVLFNQNWKFYQGTPPGTPQNPTYDDALWTTVGVPHSASYDPPSVAGELAFYGSPGSPNKNYWYRKKFICPSNARNVFIQFEAVMQSAIVYVNGSQVGSHYNSGYTGFSFDISNYVVRGDTTLIAVQCNINNDANIPPGGSNWTTSGSAAPDYLLFSGMYRNVRLLFKDSVYVPLRGQRITTTGSTTSPTVHAVTSVRNDATAAKSVTVALTLCDMSGTIVATGLLNQSVAAGSTYNFDMTTGAISLPSLWSPLSPYLYSLQTMVSVNGSIVDSVVEPVGLRFYSWSANTPGGFFINDTRTELKGVCLAQFMGWIENAVPDSRFAKQVAMIKAMGINSIRTSHYPRADAFYHACDSIGMLVLVEVPSWGAQGGFSGLTTFWNRMYSCDSEMVLDGYNHPCIYGWSLFNEPSETTLGGEFTNEMSIIHALDPVSGSGRVTLIANNAGNVMYPLDIYGLNYLTSTSTTIPIVNTENYQNWYRVFWRGNAMDLDVSAASEAYAEVSQMTAAWNMSDKCGGAHFWCFQDYCSFRNQIGLEGIVDRLWIPKNVYFMFRNNLTGAATDYWQNGTPTQLALTADLTTLRADGSDVSQIVATLRDAGGQCMHTACDITFTATPAGTTTLFPDTGTTYGNPVTVPVRGGRTGVLLRTTTTPGTITVIATSSCGLPQATVTLNSTAVSETIPALVWSRMSVRPGSQHQYSDVLRLKIVYSIKGVKISFPSGVEKTVLIIDCRGKTIASYTLKCGFPVLVGHTITGSGIFYAVWDDNGRRMLTRLNIIR